MRRRSAVLGLGALSLLPVVALAAPPNSHRDPLADGCQRNQGGVIALTSPEWVYVGRRDVVAARASGNARAGVRTIVGTVGQIHPAGQDQFVNHDFNDVTFGVRPDRAYHDVLGTGNIDDTGPDRGLVEVEWETVKFPTWAWPQPGDRATVSGSWVWDCGHWGEDEADPTKRSKFVPYDPVETAQDIVAPGAIRGEKTEMHPPFEVAVVRRGAAGVLAGTRRGSVLSRLDVWLNGDGGGALAEEECALAEVRPSAAQVACPRVREIGGAYHYRLPLGPRPTASSQLVVNPVVRRAESDPAVHIPVQTDYDARRNAVDVRFVLPPFARRYGVTVEAGWTGAAAAVHHHVVIERATVLGTLDGPTEPSLNPVNNGPEQTPEPGEWVMYAAVNDQWKQLPGFSQVHVGDVVTVNTAFDVWLPRGVAPSLFVGGRECDIPFIDCTRERFDGVPNPGFDELGFNDQPGRIGTPQRFLPLRRGTVRLRPQPNLKPGTSVEQLSDSTCGRTGCYEVVVTTR
ncbi:MAG: hypothetical protein LC640_03150 [Frankia sp.]|nr:hypothetical protein [Frankia sp.]